MQVPGLSLVSGKDCAEQLLAEPTTNLNSKAAETYKFSYFHRSVHDPAHLKPVTAIPKESTQALSTASSRKNPETMAQWLQQATKPHYLRKPFPVGLGIALRVQVRKASIALCVTHADHKDLELEYSMLQGSLHNPRGRDL